MIGPGEPVAVEIVNFDGRTPMVVVCDHASNAIPASLSRLGLDHSLLQRHIAHDIGAAVVARLMAERLDCPAVLSGYSRLVIDCNRQPGDPQAIPAMSDGITVPGNLDLSEEKEATRVELFHKPYHDAVSRVLAHVWHRGRAPWLFSVHSFTPRLMGGEDRLWDIGVLWNRDGRLALPLIKALKAHDLHVGDNQPYSGRDIAYTLDRHAGGAGLPHVAVEIRQDLLLADHDRLLMAEILCKIVNEMLIREDLHGVVHF